MDSVFLCYSGMKSGTNAVKPYNSEVILNLQENDICHIVMDLIQPEVVKNLQRQEAEVRY